MSEDLKGKRPINNSTKIGALEKRVRAKAEVYAEGAKEVVRIDLRVKCVVGVAPNADDGSCDRR